MTMVDIIAIVASLITGAYVVRYGNRALHAEKAKSRRFQTGGSLFEIEQMREWRDSGVLEVSDQDLVLLEEIAKSDSKHLVHLRGMIDAIQRATEEDGEEVQFRLTITEVTDTVSEPASPLQRPSLELTTVYGM